MFSFLPNIRQIWVAFFINYLFLNFSECLNIKLNKLTQNQIPKRFMMNGGDKNFDGIPLREVTEKLTEFAPTTLAESWDNVGLLVEPCRNQLVKRILLTNDLTEDVMDEAIEVSANLIISYHPPLFAPLKKITRATWKERIVSLCLANNISIYSPHTSWDVVQGGVNDWLASAFDFSEIKPLVIQKPDVSKSTYTLILESTDSDLPNSLLGKYASDNDFKILMSEKSSNDAKTKLTIQCSNTVLQKVVPLLQESSNVTCFYVNPQHTVGEVVSGIGRMCKLKNKITIKEAVEKLKQHLNLPSVQLALARKATLDEEIKTIAVVAGSGGSLLKNIYCDLKITGEASHHEVLDSIHNGASVILTNHSNSERGFLLKFKEILASLLNNPNVSIIVSSTDTDPLKVY